MDVFSRKFCSLQKFCYTSLVATIRFFFNFKPIRFKPISLNIINVWNILFQLKQYVVWIQCFKNNRFITSDYQNVLNFIDNRRFTMFCYRFCRMLLECSQYKYFWQTSVTFNWCCYRLSKILYEYWTRFIGKRVRRWHMARSTSCWCLVFYSQVCFKIALTKILRNDSSKAHGNEQFVPDSEIWGF